MKKYLKKYKCTVYDADYDIIEEKYIVLSVIEIIEKCN